MGKQISIYYNDTPDAVSRIDGILLSRDSNWIVIKSNKGKRVGIPRERIVRTEEPDRTEENQQT